jgi:hypothetical protein
MEVSIGTSLRNGNLNGQVDHFSIETYGFGDHPFYEPPQ